MGDQYEITLAAWIKPASFGSEETGILVKGHDKKPFYLLLSEEGKLAFGYNKNNPDRSMRLGKHYSASSLTIDTWQHIGITIDYSSETLSMYIDGRVDATHTMQEGWLLGYTDEHLYIGSDGNTPGTFYHGAMDELHIYSRALLAAEINTLRNSTVNVRIAETERRGSLVIYPNVIPENGTASVLLPETSTSGNYQLRVINMLGQIVYSETILKDDSGGKQTLSHTASYTSGIYHMFLEHNNRILKAGKFIVQ